MGVFAVYNEMLHPFILTIVTGTIAIKTSNIGGTASKNDHNAIVWLLVK